MRSQSLIFIETVAPIVRVQLHKHQVLDLRSEARPLSAGLCGDELFVLILGTFLKQTHYCIETLKLLAWKLERNIIKCGDALVR